MLKELLEFKVRGGCLRQCKKEGITHSIGCFFCFVVGSHNMTGETRDNQCS
jgi:hypothetical protein